MEKPPEIIESHTEEIINSQLDIKLGQFMEEEVDTDLKKIKSRKAVVLNETPTKL